MPLHDVPLEVSGSYFKPPSALGINQDHGLNRGSNESPKGVITDVAHTNPRRGG